MAEKTKVDVRAATEWAWLEYDNCVSRNSNNVAIAIDFEKRSTEAPAGGQQMLDMAFHNRAAFNTHSLKVLGNDLDGEDETVAAEKKSVKELRVLLGRFEKAGKEKKAKAKLKSE